MRTIAMIPARMGSSRFPGKPLADICGLTMIEHVWRRVRMNGEIADLYIATCDEEISVAAEKFGANVIMTSDRHTRCTDRVAEGCLKLIKQNNDFDIVINIQGDEPLFNPAAIDFILKPFTEENDIAVVNLMEELKKEDEINNPNNLKVVFDRKGFALYISRSPIPHGAKSRHFKQLGAYAFTKDAIVKYSEMPETSLEIAESDDMLRFVENGIPVKFVLTPYLTRGVDTPDDKAKVSALMEKDEIYQKYRRK